MRSVVILKSSHNDELASHADLRIDRLISSFLLLTCISWLDLLPSQEIVKVRLAYPVGSAKFTGDQLPAFNKPDNCFAVEAKPVSYLLQAVDAFSWHFCLS